jgi:transposase
MRWRAIVLTYLYGIEAADVATVLGISPRSITRWYKLFKENGNVLPRQQEAKTARWPDECVLFVSDYVAAHPCFYLEELKESLKTRFPRLKTVSMSTVCRALRFDLGLSRKVLTKRARESVPSEIQSYYDKLQPFYSGPDQLVFIDETAKDGRDVMRRYAWSRRGTQAVVSTPFNRGDRLSVVAAMDVTGFTAWGTTSGTFDRHKFHEIFRTEIAPLLNPWPLPR